MSTFEVTVDAVEDIPGPPPLIERHSEAAIDIPEPPPPENVPALAPLGRLDDFNLAMKKALGDETSATNMMATLRAHTQNSRTVKKISRNKEAISTLLDSLNSKPKFTKMVEYSVECLKNLAVDQVSAEELVDEGVVEALEKILQLNPYNAKIQTAVNQCLMALTKNAELTKDVGERLGTRAVLHSIKKHVEPEVLSSTCTVATKLSKVGSNADAFVQAGIVPAVEQVLAKNLDHVEVVGSATALLQAVAGRQDYALLIMETGAMGRVLQGVRSFPYSATVVKPAVGLAAVMCATGGPVLEKLKKMNALDVLVSALEAHPEDKELLTQGAGCLKLLSGTDDLSVLLAITAGNNIATAGATSKMSALLLVSENVDYLVKNSGVEWILLAIKAATGDQSEVAKKILTNGCRALKRVCTSPERVYTVMVKGGVPVILNVINKHVESETISYEALGALSSVVINKDNAFYVNKLGGVDAALRIYHEHPDSDKIQRAVLDFMQRMATFDDQMLQQIVDKGAIELVAGILERCGMLDAEIAVRCMGFLGAISSLNNNKYLQRVADHALNAVLSVAKHHQGDPAVVMSAFNLLSLFGTNKANLDLLRKKGAVGDVLALMDVHSENPSVQEDGALLLNSLGGVQVPDAIARLVEYSGKIKAKPADAGYIKKFNLAVNMLSGLALVADNIPVMVQHGGVDAFLQAIEAAKAMPPSETRDAILVKCADGLSRLSNDPTAEAKIIADNVPATLLTLATEEANNELLGTASVAFLQKLVDKPENAEALFKKKIMRQLGPAAVAHEGSETTLHSAVKAMSKLGYDDDAKEEIFWQPETPMLCVDAMYALNPQCVSDSLDLVFDLVLPDPDAQKVDALKNAGIVDGITTALRRHGADEAVALKCIEVGPKGLFLDPAFQGALGAQAIPCLVKLLQDHSHNEFLVEATIVTLDGMSKQDGFNEAILEPSLDAVKILEKVTKQWESNPAIKETGKRLLYSIRGPSEEELREIAERQRREEEERLRREEEERRQEEERRRLEEEARLAEEARIRAEEEKRRLEEEQRRLEEERKERERREEEERLRIEAERRREEEERQRLEQERLRLEEEERKRREEEEKMRLLEEAEREKTRIRLEEERRRAEEERLRLEEERKRQEEERKRQEEERRKQEEERKRQEEERRRLEEEERKRREEERRRQEEERKRQEEERKRLAEKERLDRLLYTTVPPTLDKERVRLMLNKLEEGQLLSEDAVKLLDNVHALTSPNAVHGVPWESNATAWIENGGMPVVSKLMRDHPDRKVQLAAAKVWASLADNHPELVAEEFFETFVDLMASSDSSGGVPSSIKARAINAISKTKLKDPTIAKNMNDQVIEQLSVAALDPDSELASTATRVLAKVSTDEKALQTIKSKMAPKALIDAMKHHMDNPDFIKSATYLLAAMASTGEQMQSLIGDCGGVEVIVQVIKTYPSQVSIVEDGCYALSNLTFKNPPNIRRCVDAHGLEVLLETTRNNPTAVELLDHALRSLLNCSKEKEQKNKVVAAGGAGALADISLNNINNLDVVKTCCVFDALLATSRENVAPMVRQGTAQSVVAAMAVYNTNEELVRTGLRVIGSLLVEQNPDLERILTKEGVIEATVDSLEHFPSNHVITLTGLGILTNLALQPENCAVIVKNSGMKIAIDVARAYNHEPKTVELAVQLLANLSEEAKNLGLKPPGHVLDGLLETLAQFGPKDPIVARACLRALANFAWTEEVAAELRKRGAAGIVAGNLEAFDMIGGTELVAQALDALSALARDEKAAVEIIEPALTFLAQSLTDDPNLQNNEEFIGVAMKFFADATYYATAAERLAQFGPKTHVLKQVNNILRNHDRNKKIQLRALTGFENVAAGGKDLKNLMKAEESVMECQELMERTMYDEVRNACQRVVEETNKVPTIIYRKLNLRDDDAPTEQLAMSRDLKNFLIAGSLVKKWTSSGQANLRHLRVTPELDWLSWPAPSGTASDEQKIRVYNLRAVERGLVTARLRVKRLGKFIIPEGNAFSVSARGRTIDVEVESHALRERWVNALHALIVYTKSLKINQ